MPEPDARPKDIVINGRFLAQGLSGVQRYAREITTALDALIVADPAVLGARRWQLAIPPGVTSDLPLNAIEPISVGTRSGQIWEQVDLMLAARGKRLVNLGNSGPLLHRDSFVVIHDAAPFRTPENFGAKYGLYHRALGRLLAKTARLGTVSEFSRGELAEVLHVPKEKIFVANNGCDHLIGRARSSDVLQRVGVERGKYFLFVGSPTPNKNLPIALEAFQQLARPDARFVVAGSLNKAVFGGDSPGSIAGVIFASGLSDSDIAGLYADAAAHIFPTRYEGFGIPPLEAMACGCPVIASDIPVVREVCGDAAAYFVPDNAPALTALMAGHLDRASELRALRTTAATARVAHFTWARAAHSLANAVLLAEARR